MKSTVKSNSNRKFSTRIMHWDREAKGFKLPVQVNHRSKREAFSTFTLAASLIRGSQNQPDYVGSQSNPNWALARVELIGRSGATLQSFALSRSERNKAQIRLSAKLHPEAAMAQAA